MFMLTTDPSAGRHAFAAMARLLPVPVGAVHEVEVGTHTLLWARVQMRDNLHVYPDGALIGRVRADEMLSDAPLHHADGVRSDLAVPNLGAVVIRCASGPGSAPTVEPLGVTQTFTCGDSCSDRTLLLAAARGLRPSAEGFAVLAGIGYFPGNMTLFSEINRIPFLHRWSAKEQSSTRTRELRPQRPDDDAMIDRLVSIVPSGVTHALGLSGGYDSRFVLGVLHRAGADVRIVRFTDGETPIVEAIAAALGLEVEGVGSIEEAPGAYPPLQFTLMSDAQIWHGVSQHGRLARLLGPEEFFHSGQFSDSINKNAFKTAWKRPGRRRDLWNRLAADALLPNVPDIQPGVKACAQRADVESVVRRSIDYQREYVDFPKRKQWANWVYYMNRGMRWAQAFHDDLTFGTNLTFLLSDIDAQLLGIATGFWENFHNDRAAELNRRMLPEVSTGYQSGAPVDPIRGIRGAIDKVEYEFLTRARVNRSGRARLRSLPTTYADDLPNDEPSGWDHYVDRPMGVDQDAGSFGLRRAKVTLANVLTFLDAVEVGGEHG